jgi:hypothetical protein
MRWKIALVAPIIALGFAGTAHAKALDTPTAVCAIGNFGNPPVNGFETTGTGYTAGHTYYARVAQPGSPDEQVLYQSSAGEFFNLTYDIGRATLYPGKYTISIYKSVTAYRNGDAEIAGCSAVAP